MVLFGAPRVGCDAQLESLVITVGNEGATVESAVDCLKCDHFILHDRRVGGPTMRDRRCCGMETLSLLSCSFGSEQGAYSLWSAWVPSAKALCGWVCVLDCSMDRLGCGVAVGRWGSKGGSYDEDAENS